MVRILGENEVTKEYLSQVVAIKTKVYGKKKDIRKYERIHHKNPGSFNIMVNDENIVIGCVETLPVTSGSYKKLKSGKEDKAIDKHILSKKAVRKGKPINIYISDFIIDPLYQNSTATFKLYGALKKKIKSLNNEGVIIDSSIAHARDNVSERACKIYGMEKIANNVYEKRRV